MEIVVPEDFQYLYTRESTKAIVKIPHPALRQKAAPIAKITKKTQELIDGMLRIMRAANGIGLAAPQLGIGQRIIVIAPEGMKPTALINPRVTKSDGSEIGEEGCLSIPGLYGDVTRPASVEVEALDRKGHKINLSLKGMKARVVQHEIDHLDGVLFIDKVDASTLHWMHPDNAASEAE